MNQGRLTFALAVFLPAAPLLADPYVFQTVISPADPAFTQLLGINNASVIAGYFGDGSVVANNGFTLVLPNTFTPENFPASAQTQVVGINNSGNTAGFYVDAGGTTHGFTDTGGTFSTVDAPGTLFNQLLGLNDAGVSAGYSSATDAGGATGQRAFTTAGGTFSYIAMPAGTQNSQATDVNNAADVSGFYVDGGGIMHGFLMDGGPLMTLDIPGSKSTQALGLNNGGLVVGDYIDASNAMHGFAYNLGTATFQTVDDPSGIGTTTINGINDNGQLVGFYVDAAGNTDGFVATPTATAVPEPRGLILLGTALAGVTLKLRRRTA